MAKTTLLFTGATGMIGFRTLIHLLEQGSFNVRVAVRSQSSLDKLLSYKQIAPYASQLESTIVPDITVPGAYDEAVKGVTHIIHVASPIPSAQTADFETDLVQPAIQGTVGILQSAHKVTGIKKIVITASIAAISSEAHSASGATVTEETRATDIKRPFANAFAAYAASKALSFEATDDFIAKHNPAFSVVRILPTFVVGRDDTVTNVSQIAKGTNGLVMGPLLGHPQDNAMSGASVHIDDVAKLHVLALDPAISDHETFLASNPASFQWADSFDIVKRRYPEQYAAGLFKFDSIPRPETRAVHVDSSKATKTLGIQFKTFEEQVVSVVDHYLELVTAK
ncbi:NAD-dependent epimerase/dehydratase FUM13 [Beauveria bassiana]|uniref:NAD dependent epimerase/dehydratase n=1 Tax=Beauveria bassiana (strain ARSEF 2860) TaxID=655819 RepID=J4WE64_BEAB2|nr:NAD dependent epimerase/dehydratase [Beauveria bassiana ARSEF 2860]EJP68280.1 NAD dependent epimerase/dehydratase [Beauveria bassiana ARSEF 2860]KAH8713379.1 NAD-dependent epimerase/dehydratase FUM13 [Beauveria bassiana]